MGMGSPLSPQGRGGRKKFRPISDINVTPMVDVMLVLLVVFMISAPLMNSGVPVDLPTNSAPPLSDKDQPVMVTLNRDNALFVGDQGTTQADLPLALQAATAGNREKRVYLRADQGLSYGTVMDVMGTIRDAGYTKVALVSEPGPQTRKA